MISLFLALLTLSEPVHAESLRCASTKNETLYYDTGRAVLSAEVVSDTQLSQVNLSFEPARKLGSTQTAAEGVVKGNYVRFPLGGDAWCSYKIAAPVNFRGKRGSFPLFLDAYCESNSNYNIRLYCSLR